MATEMITTGNPYWDAVQAVPVDDIHLKYTGERVPDFRARHDMVGEYSWAICSPRDIAWMVGVLDGRGVVEIGAGRGYWAWQLYQAGVDVVAYDVAPPNLGENKYHRAGGAGGLRTYYPILAGGPEKVVGHGDRALFLCWPPYESDSARLALSAYAGDLLVYCGEGEGGCCADDDFFSLLDEWEEVGECPDHPQWFGIHDWLTAYRRKPAP